MMKVIIPQETNKIQQQINALKEILPMDDEKSKEIHVQAIIDLEKALITDFIYKEKNIETNTKIKNVDKIIEELKTNCYINNIYYSLAVKRLQECFDDCEQLIVPQEIASYYSDVIDIIVNVIDIDDMEYRMDNIA